MERDGFMNPGSEAIGMAPELLAALNCLGLVPLENEDQGRHVESTACDGLRAENTLVASFACHQSSIRYEALGFGPALRRTSEPRGLHPN